MGRAGEIVDRYRIEADLGEGGFGDVYRAVHTITGRPVALKVLRRDHLDNPQVLERFLLEARAAASVGNQHIVDVLDAGRTDDGRAFLAMELLDGETLESRLEREAPLRGDIALDIALQILDGLGAAHRGGIVHRDLKPANVLLEGPSGTDTPRAKLLDFGVSKFMPTAGSPSLTKTGMVLGTPSYMAPEQFGGAKTVDARADLFSVCVLLYEMLSGKMPFPASTYEELIVRVTTARPVPLTEVAPWLPAGLKHVIERGLSKDPDGRFGSARELSDALKTLATASTLDVLKLGGVGQTFERPRPAAPTPEGNAFGTGPTLPSQPGLVPAVLPAAPVAAQPTPSPVTARPPPAAYPVQTPPPTAALPKKKGLPLGWIAVIIGALGGAAVAALGVFVLLAWDGGDAGSEGEVGVAPIVPVTVPTGTVPAAPVSEGNAAEGPEPANEQTGSAPTASAATTGTGTGTGTVPAAPVSEGNAAEGPEPANEQTGSAPTASAPTEAPSNSRVRVVFQPLSASFPSEVGRNIARRAQRQMGRCARPGRHRHTIQVQYSHSGALMQSNPHPPWNEDPVAVCAASVFEEIGSDGAPAGGIIRFVVTIE